MSLSPENTLTPTSLNYARMSSDKRGLKRAEGLVADDRGNPMAEPASGKLRAFAPKVTDPACSRAYAATVRFIGAPNRRRGRHVYRGLNGGRGLAVWLPLQASGRCPTVRGELKKQISAEQK
jgi:hypothetical protein